MKTSAYTPFEVGAKDRVVGVFVIGAVLLFLIGFLIPALQSLSADEGVPFHTILDQTYGIAPNATVSLRGVVIGNVTSVGITKDASVRVDFKLSSVYLDFYREGSKLTVDSNIGVSTILTGSGLILTPGSNDKPALAEGGFISTEIPQGIGSILETIDIAQLADQVTEIVTNVEEITTGINVNQDKIYKSLDNLQEVTANLAEISKSLPGMTQSVDKSLASLEETMSGVNTMVTGTDKNLQPVIRDMALLTRQATTTLAETETLLQAMTPVMNQLPTFLITTDVTLQSVTQLTDQLSRSWLLGGGGESVSTNAYAGPSSHPHDDDLYTIKPKSSLNQGDSP